MKGEWIPLADDPIMAVLPKDHPLAHAPSYPLARCAEEDFIMPRLAATRTSPRARRSRHIPAHRLFNDRKLRGHLDDRMRLGMSIMNELITKCRTLDAAIIPLDPPRAIHFGIAYPSAEKLSPRRA